VVEAFKDLVGLSCQEVAVGLMKRFRLEDAARARMEEFRVDRPWQAYVQIRLGIYEALLANSKGECLVQTRQPQSSPCLDGRW
jgi:hypothetical protein